MPTIVTYALLIVLGLNLVACTTRPQISNSPGPLESIEQLAMAAFAEMDREAEDRLGQYLAEFPPEDRPKVQDLARDFRESDQARAAAIDREFENWTPNCAQLVDPQAHWLCPELDIEGFWQVSSGYTSTSLTVRYLTDNRYAVRFSTAGCTDNWTLDRIGTIESDMLVLYRPVRNYMSKAYDRLYLVRIGGREFLLPNTLVGNVHPRLGDSDAAFHSRVLLARVIDKN